MVRHALSQACAPLFHMLTQWLVDGALEDPHHEFFISADPAVPHMKLWHDKYDIRYFDKLCVVHLYKLCIFL